MMDIDDAYVLAKGKRVGDSPPTEEIESERPMVTPYGDFSGRRTETKSLQDVEGNPPAAPTHGLAGFRSIVQAGVNKTIGAKTYQGR
jgi:hypothetical protein